MAQQYKDNTVIPKPNRFLVTEEQYTSAQNSPSVSTDQGLNQTLIIEKETTTPVPNTDASLPAILDNDALLGQLQKLFPQLGIDINQLGTILYEYSSLKSTIQQIQDRITLGVSEEYQAELEGVGGLDGLYTKIENISAELEILRNSVRLAVESTSYDGLETYMTGTINDFASNFRQNVAVVAEQLTQTTAEINVLRSKIELGVGEVNAEGLYTNAVNEEMTETWANTVGVYDAALNGFEFSDSSGWIGTGANGDYHGLRFNGGQYLIIDNPMKDDTTADQSFTAEAFLKLRSGLSQKLTSLGLGMYLSNANGVPSLVMNSGASEISLTGLVGLDTNSLLHVAYTFDAQLREIRLFVNGQLVEATKVWKSDYSVAAPSSIAIGQGMVGDLYTFRVYSRLFTEADASGNYAQGVLGSNYSREGLVISLEGRKAQTISKAIDTSRSEIKMMKDSIVSRVTRTEMETAIATSSGYIVIFENENQSFPTEYDGSLSTGIIVESAIDVFKGSTRIAALIGPPVLKNHAGAIIDFGTMTVVNPTATEPGRFTWTLPQGTNISSDFGSIELDFNMSGVHLLKKITWSKAKRGQTGPQGDSVYKVEVVSSNGNIFSNGEVNSILYAVIYYGGVDVTATISADRCIWTRTSSNPAADEIWNAEHSMGSKSIAIDINDVYERATFSCDLY